MKRAIFPYPTLAADLETKVANVRLDGKPIKTDFMMTGDRVMDVGEAAIEAWEKLTFDVEVQSHKDTVKAYEENNGEIKLAFVASCRPTNTRQIIELTRSDEDLSLWAGTVELNRDCFRGKVSLHAILTCELDEELPKPIGFSEAWTIYFDATDSLRVSGSLKVVWYDFTSSEAPPIARQFPKAPYVVDLEKPLPEIYLNETFEGLEPLLRDKQRTGVEKVLHDTMRMSMGRSVWMTLVNDSMAAIRKGIDGEEHQWPERSWQTEVLQRVLPEVDSSRSESQLLDSAATEWREYPGASTFQGRAEAAVGEIIDANKTLRKSIQKLIREGIV